MKFRQGDIIQLKKEMETEEYSTGMPGINRTYVYDCVMIAEMPGDDVEDSDYMYIVDAYPCRRNGVKVLPDGASDTVFTEEFASNLGQA